MKNCKNCGAQLEDAISVCPYCGEQLEEQEKTEDPAVLTDPVQQTSAAASEESIAEPAAKPAAKKGLSTGAMVGIVAGLLALIAVLAVLIWKNVQSERKQADLPDDAKTSQTQTQSPTASDSSTPSVSQEETTAPAGNGVSYTIAAEDLTDEIADQVVAQCGDVSLTNRDLPFFYWQQYYTFADNYSQYLSYIIDPSRGLDEQMYDEENTWQQAFLDSAVQMFYSVSALRQEAQRNGFTLSEEDQATIDSIRQNLSKSAISSGYQDAASYLQRAFGPLATLDGYEEFARNSMIAQGYMKKLLTELEYTEQDVSDYYDMNAVDYVTSGVEKDDQNTIAVRHILIVPDESDVNGDYTDAAWKRAETQANSILDQWLAGEKTEDSFAQLAMSFSVDGSAANGGLYTNVFPGEMVPEFNDWCFDPARQAGDYGIVQTQFGYHIMYFSGIEDHPYWYNIAEVDYINSRSLELEDQFIAAYQTQMTLDNAAIVDVLH